ncbi:tyrosine recombinase XerC [bacterium BMS3Bbin04]|nr:tyrosine recombinase XerC [bacterium BMS3Bbin04]
MPSLEGRAVRNGTTWRYKYRDRDGNQKSIKIGLTSKRVADQRKTKLDSMLAMGLDPAEEVGRRTPTKISELMTIDHKWAQHRLQPRTIELNRGIVMRFIEFAGDIPITKVTRRLAEEYLAHCASELSYATNTTNMHLRQLKALFNRGIKHHGLLKQNPFQGIEPYVNRTRRDYLEFITVEQLDALLEAAKNRWGEHVHRLLRFYSLTGARRGEATDLKWSEVDYKRGFLYLGQERSQTKLRRDFPIRHALRDLLDELKDDRQGHEHVFWRFHGKASHISTRLAKMNGTVEGIPESIRIKPHLLRHTFASHLVMAGVDMRTVASLLGHSTTKITEIYSHLAESHRNEALDKLPY